MKPNIGRASETLRAKHAPSIAPGSLAALWPSVCRGGVSGASGKPVASDTDRVKDYVERFPDPLEMA